MFNAIKTKLAQFVQQPNTSPPAKEKPIFVNDPVLGVQRRQYETYEDYLNHQAEKLGKVGENIVQSDREYEQLVVARYRDLFDLRGKTVLCLGARLGGEVRAFKTLGALALGIDIEPGDKNLHVLHGDFHDLQFPDSCFDFAFTNVVDHVLHLDRFVSEVARVLKQEGQFLVELAQVKPGNYEVLDTSDLQPILKPFYQCFSLESQSPVLNKTQYVNWEGQLLQFRKVLTDGNHR